MWRTLSRLQHHKHTSDKSWSLSQGVTRRVDLVKEVWCRGNGWRSVMRYLYELFQLPIRIIKAFAPKQNCDPLVNQYRWTGIKVRLLVVSWNGKPVIIDILSFESNQLLTVTCLSRLCRDVFPAINLIPSLYLYKSSGNTALLFLALHTWIMLHFPHLTCPKSPVSCWEVL